MNYLAIDKLINSMKVLLNFLFGLDLRIFPVLVELDVASFCNLKCIMCPNSKMIRRKGFMSLAVLKKVINDTFRKTFEYSIGIYGEPTLNPELVEMLIYIKKHGGKVRLNTNLNYKDNRISEYFVINKVDRIIVTMCGVDKLTYEGISKNGDYELVMRNIEKIKEIKNRLGYDKPKIIANFIVMKLNSHQVSLTRKALCRHFDYCNVYRMHDWAGTQEIKSLSLKYDRPGNTRKCSFLWTTAAISYDGKILACCQDYEGRVVLGDALKMGISDVWNAQGTKQFRKYYLDSSLCSNCSHYNRYQFSIKNVIFNLKTIF